MSKKIVLIGALLVMILSLGACVGTRLELGTYVSDNKMVSFLGGSKMSKFRKFFIIGVTLIIIMSAGVFSGCKKPDYYTDRVSVSIKTEYKDKFLAEEFTVADFTWDNVKSIKYEGWYDTIYRGIMTVYLKKAGKLQIKNAINHFEGLDFVYIAEHISEATTA